MDSDKIIQELNQRFAAPLPEFYKRRIIFWYDEDGEFRERLDEVTLNNAKLVALTGNQQLCGEKTSVGGRYHEQFSGILPAVL